MHLTHRLGAGILAGSLIAAGAGSAFAAASHAHARAHLRVAYGQVSNLSATGFTLTRTLKHPRANGTSTVLVQVVTSAATKNVARKGTTGTLLNGEYAMAAGTTSTSGLVASRVVFSTTPFSAHRHRVAGTVSASTPTSLTVQTRKGTLVTFEITSQTRVRVNRQLQTAVPAFTQGERVVVSFVKDKATKNRMARVIAIRPTTAPATPQP